MELNQQHRQDRKWRSFHPAGRDLAADAPARHDSAGSPAAAAAALLSLFLLRAAKAHGLTAGKLLPVRDVAEASDEDRLNQIAPSECDAT